MMYISGNLYTWSMWHWTTVTRWTIWTICVPEKAVYDSFNWYNVCEWWTRTCYDHSRKYVQKDG